MHIKNINVQNTAMSRRNNRS